MKEEINQLIIQNLSDDIGLKAKFEEVKGKMTNGN